MTEAIRSLAADARHDLTYHKPSRFFVVALAIMVVFAVVFSLLGNAFAREILAFMAGGIPAGMLVVLMTYHPRLRKPAIAFALAAMPVWIVLGFASLWPSLRWLEPAFGGVSGTGFTLAAAVQGAVMLCMIQGLLALFGKHRRV